ncbi:hypothetical protein [Streptomyces sp. KE1]|uniref:hypothetical protein n=1 Tax=Streptomyces sp. KE1 TaxID=1638939 RepID=UPI001900A6E5|nr:hypothetical protein [Streptomyces sp. KE1]
MGQLSAPLAPRLLRQFLVDPLVFVGGRGQVVNHAVEAVEAVERVLSASPNSDA